MMLFLAVEFEKVINSEITLKPAQTRRLRRRKDACLAGVMVHLFGWFRTLPIESGT